MNDDTPDSEDFQEFLRRMMSGGNVDPAALSELFQGLGDVDAQSLQAMFAQLMGGAGIGGLLGQDPWEQARQQSLHIANRDGRGIGEGDRTDLRESFSLAALWLAEATAIAELTQTPNLLTRGDWVEQTLPVWKEIAVPVSTSIADALMKALDGQVPEEMRGLVSGAGELMRGMGAALFAAQFGQVLGRLALEVVSGGDVGIPVLPAGEAALVPQNLADFGAGLEIPPDQIALFLATRELAYARLYRHAKWLRLHVLSKIHEFAAGVRVDVDALEDVASRLDPSNPQELKEALESGALLPQQTEAQKEALARLEDLIALVDGWVDVVTMKATSRLPDGLRIAEAARRRRAVGGPAEDALGALVGLKLRPRRLREASAMWQAITDAVGITERDALWDYPDLIPGSDDIDDPSALISRLQAHARGEEPQPDEMDEALARLLDGDDFRDIGDGLSDPGEEPPTDPGNEPGPRP